MSEFFAQLCHAKDRQRELDREIELQRLKNEAEQGSRMSIYEKIGEGQIEIERLEAIIRDIARIVENPDSRAPRQVRDITDKESMRSV